MTSQQMDQLCRRSHRRGQPINAETRALGKIRRYSAILGQ